jgi:hypothetical protein
LVVTGGSDQSCGKCRAAHARLDLGETGRFKDAIPHFSAVDVNRARASVQNRVRAFVQAASDLGFMLA